MDVEYGKQQLVGAVILSECLNCVALIRRGDVWNFPCAVAPDEMSEQEAVVTVVQELIGLDISDKLNTADVIEADTHQPNQQSAKLYVAVDVPEDDLVAGSDVDEAVWKPLEHFLRRDDLVVNSSMPHKAYIPGLRRYIERHPELQTEAVDVELKASLSYNPDTWVGVAPKDHLAEWCEQHELPCNTYQAAPKGRERFLGTCVLNCIGIQITPVELFPTTEQAEQSAALFAIVFLEGGFSGFSHYCRVVPVGFGPEQRPESIVPFNDALTEEERTKAIKDTILQEVESRRTHLLSALAELDRQKEVLEAGGYAAMDIITRHYAWRRPGSRPGRGRGGYGSYGYGRGRGGTFYFSGRQRAGPPSKRPKMGQEAAAAGEAAPAGPQDPNKTPVQVLKEHCDVNKWSQPTYEFKDESVAGRPAFKCYISIREGNITSLESTLQPNHRSAKSAAARLALQALQLG